MKQPEFILYGTTVITHAKLSGAKVYNMSEETLMGRKPDQRGVIMGVVGGMGGDVYLG